MWLSDPHTAILGPIGSLCYQGFAVIAVFSNGDVSRRLDVVTRSGRVRNSNRSPSPVCQLTFARHAGTLIEATQLSILCCTYVIMYTEFLFTWCFFFDFKKFFSFSKIKMLKCLRLEERSENTKIHCYYSTVPDFKCVCLWNYWSNYKYISELKSLMEYWMEYSKYTFFFLLFHKKKIM